MRPQIPTGHSGVFVSNAIYRSEIILLPLLILLIYTSKDYYFNTSCYSTVTDMHV